MELRIDMYALKMKYFHSVVDETRVTLITHAKTFMRTRFNQVFYTYKI